MSEAASFLGSTPVQSVLFAETGLRRVSTDQSSTFEEARETNVRPVSGREAHRQDARATPACATTACATSHEGRGKRRAYNRDYMRLWRERNRERYRSANRDYQRKRALRRKAKRQSASQTIEPGKCWYRCGRPAVTTIERVHPETWQTISVPYCGFC